MGKPYKHFTKTGDRKAKRAKLKERHKQELACETKDVWKGKITPPRVSALGGDSGRKFFLSGFDRQLKLRTSGEEE